MTFLTVLTEQYLMEAIIDNVMKAHPDVDPSIIKHYDNQSVPEHAKQHLDWVIRQHKKGNIVPADAHTLKPYIESYTKYKDKIGDNINKFDVQGLKDSVKRFINSNSSSEAKVGNTKTIHEDDDIIIKQHKGFEAAASMGKLPDNNPYHHELNGHAKWCISLRGGQNKSHLSTYTEGGKHPVYSIENKNTGRKYALVANPNERIPEFRDEHDNRPNMHTFLTDNPSVLHTKPGKFLQAHFSDAKDFADTFHGHDIKTLTEGQIRSLYDEHEGDYSVTSLLMKQKNAPADLLEKHYHDHKNANGVSVKEFTSVSNKNFPKSVIDKVVEHGTTHDGDHLADMSRHAHLSSENIDKITNYAKETGDRWQVSHLVSNPNINLTNKQKHALIDISAHDASPLLQKEKDPHIIDKIVKGTDNAYRKNYSVVANKKDILPSTYSHLLNHIDGNDYSSEYKKSLANHPLAKTHAYDVLMDSAKHGKEVLNYDVKNDLMKNGNFTKEQQMHLINAYRENSKKLAQKPDATSEDHTRKNVLFHTLQNLYSNSNLHPDVVNHLYNNAKEFDMANSARHGTTRLRFSNNAHKLTDENFNDLMNTPHGAALTALHMDFKNNPEMVDKIKKYGVPTGSWGENKSLQPEHISSLYNNGYISPDTAIKHPNTNDEIVKNISMRNKTMASKALDRPNVSPDTIDAIVKTHFKNKPTGIMKKMVNHQSIGSKSFGTIIDSLKPTHGEFTSNSTSKFRKDTVHELYKNNSKLTNKQLDQVMNMPMHQKTIKTAIKDGVSDKHIKMMMQNNHREFQQWTGDTKNGSEMKPNPEMFEAVMKSSGVGKETLSHMMDNKDKFIPKGQENYVARRLSEEQGQMSLPFTQGKKK